MFVCWWVISALILAAETSKQVWLSMSSRVWSAGGGWRGRRGRSLSWSAVKTFDGHLDNGAGLYSGDNQSGRCQEVKRSGLITSYWLLHTIPAPGPVSCGGISPHIISEWITRTNINIDLEPHNANIACGPLPYRSWSFPSFEKVTKSWQTRNSKLQRDVPGHVLRCSRSSVGEET